MRGCLAKSARADFLVKFLASVSRFGFEKVSPGRPAGQVRFLRSRECVA